jgi:hypothetical protein
LIHPDPSARVLLDRKPDGFVRFDRTGYAEYVGTHPVQISFGQHHPQVLEIDYSPKRLRYARKETLQIRVTGD